MARIYLASNWRNQYYPEAVPLSGMPVTKYTISAIRRAAEAASIGPIPASSSTSCGRSSHTEAGWFAGKGVKTIVYMPEEREPELMYKLFDGGVGRLSDLLAAL